MRVLAFVFAVFDVVLTLVVGLALLAAGIAMAGILVDATKGW